MVLLQDRKTTMNHHVKQIRIGKHDFGIIGLTTAVEAVALEYKDVADEVLAETLLQKLSKDNYISANVREWSNQSFLREYKKHFNLTIPVSEEEDDEPIVTVVGRPGCPRCKNREMEVMMALSELNLSARVEHVRGPKEIGQMGIFGTPALLIIKKRSNA
jgi:thioredoxin family protein